MSEYLDPRPRRHLPRIAPGPPILGPRPFPRLAALQHRAGNAAVTGLLRGRQAALVDRARSQPNPVVNRIGEVTRECLQAEAEAKNLVGDLNFDGREEEQHEAPLARYVFSLALKQVKGPIEKAIEDIFTVARLNKTDRNAAAQVEEFKGFTMLLTSGTDFKDPMSSRPAHGKATYAEVKIATGSFDTAPAVWDTVVDPEQTIEMFETNWASVKDQATKIAPTIVHEFTHFALERVYENNSAPYPELTPALDDSAFERRVALVRKTKEAVKEFSTTKDDQFIAGIQGRFLLYEEGEEQQKEICSHLMEIAHKRGMPYLEKTFPQGKALLDIALNDIQKSNNGNSNSREKSAVS